MLRGMMDKEWLVKIGKVSWANGEMPETIDWISIWFLVGVYFVDVAGASVSVYKFALTVLSWNWNGLGKFPKYLDQFLLYI